MLEKSIHAHQSYITAAENLNSALEKQVGCRPLVAQAPAIGFICKALGFICEGLVSELLLKNVLGELSVFGRRFSTDLASIFSPYGLCAD
jgi:hypothetical protein